MPAYGIVIAIMNWALRKSVQMTTRWLRFRDITTEAKFQMTLLFVL